MCPGTDDRRRCRKDSDSADPSEIKTLQKAVK